MALCASTGGVDAFSSGVTVSTASSWAFAIYALQPEFYGHVSDFRRIPKKTLENNGL